MPYFIDAQGIAYDTLPPTPEQPPLPLPDMGVEHPPYRRLTLPRPIKRLLILGAEIMIGFMIIAMATGMGVGIIEKLQQESSHSCSK